ncbi:hypothetical protein SprV_0802643200 [Sparganum proliferum]
MMGSSRNPKRQANKTLAPAIAPTSSSNASPPMLRVAVLAAGKVRCLSLASRVLEANQRRAHSDWLAVTKQNEKRTNALGDNSLNSGHRTKLAWRVTLQQVSAEPLPPSDGITPPLESPSLHFFLLLHLQTEKAGKTGQPEVRDTRSGRRFLVDIGAQRSYIPPTTADHRYPNPGIFYQAADASPFPLPEHRFPILFPWVVADISCAILGANFLSAFDLLVDCRQFSRQDKTPNLTAQGIFSSDSSAPSWTLIPRIHFGNSSSIIPSQPSQFQRLLCQDQQTMALTAWNVLIGAAGAGRFDIALGPLMVIEA